MSDQIVGAFTATDYRDFHRAFTLEVRARDGQVRLRMYPTAQ
jgi:hypothetical protein